ncbi:hypothetical protein Vretimale_12850, partial [Volvox reticuliferus]
QAPQLQLPQQQLPGSLPQPQQQLQQLTNPAAAAVAAAPPPLPHVGFGGAAAATAAAMAAHQQPGQLAAAVGLAGVAGGGLGPANGGPLGLPDQRPPLKPLQPLQPPGVSGAP